MNKCEYSYVPWFIFDDRLDHDPSNVIMVIITQATTGCLKKTWTFFENAMTPLSVEETFPNFLWL